MNGERPTLYLYIRRTVKMMCKTIYLSPYYQTSAKVMERVVYNRLYLMPNNLPTWRNSGFCSLDGTVNQLVNIVHNLYHDLDAGHDSCMVFLDASKAFDKVWNNGLINTLKSLGVIFWVGLKAT